MCLVFNRASRHPTCISGVNCKRAMLDLINVFCFFSQVPSPWRQHVR
jgi:hypothetical protein